MPDIHEIDAEFNSLHGVVKFRGNDQKYMLIAANKAASIAKSLTEAGTMINASDERARAINAWLLDLAGKFLRCEGEDDSSG